VLKYETRYPLDALKAAEPETIAQLTSEVQAEGAITEPIVIRVRADGSRVVWDGMHRLIAARDLGLQDIPVNYIGEGAAGLQYKGLSFKNAMKIRYFASIAALGDFVWGWKSRMDALKRLVFEKGAIETPELKAYLKNESALGNMAEILHGRRKTIEMKPTPELTADFEKAITEWVKTPDAIKYFKGEKKVSLEEILNTLENDPVGARIALSGAVDIMVKDMLGKYAGVLEDYVPYMDEAAYARSYISIYTKLLEAAIAEGIPREEVGIPERFIPTEVIPERVIPREEVVPAITEYRVPPTEPEEIVPIEEYVPVPPPRYEVPPPEYEVPPPPDYRVPPPPEYEVPPPEYEVPPPEYEVPPPPEYEVPPPRYEPAPPPRYEPVPPPEEVIPPIIPPGPPKAEVVEVKIPVGSIAWRQGMLRGGVVWKYIPPPWDMDKPLTLVGKVPTGAINTGLRTPRETVQMIGKPKAVVPKSISIDLGVVDIYVTNYGKNIKFGGRGMETDVGKRLSSPTKGMSIDGAEAPLGVRGLKLGTSLEQLLIGEYGTEALKGFGERALSLHLSKMTPEEIAEEIRDVVLPESRVEEILSHLPSRVGTSVRGLLKRKYAMLPVKAAPSERRQRAMEEEALSEKEMKKKTERNGRVISRESLPEVLEVF